MAQDGAFDEDWFELFGARAFARGGGGLLRASWRELGSCPNDAGPRFLHHLAQPEPGEPARAVRGTDPLAPVYEVMILPSLLFVALAVGGGEAAAVTDGRFSLQAFRLLEPCERFLA